MELIVTLLIISIVMTIAVPTFNYTIAHNRITNYANEFLSALNRARSEAVTRGQRVAICRSTTATATTPACATDATNAGHWELGWIIFVDVNDNATFTGSNGDTLLWVHSQFNGSITLKSASTSNITNYISYAPNGRPQSYASSSTQCSGATSCIVSLCDSVSGSKGAVIINAVGRARTDPNCSPTPLASCSATCP